jgi:hypothetical protein
MALVTVFRKNGPNFSFEEVKVFSGRFAAYVFKYCNSQKCWKQNVSHGSTDRGEIFKTGSLTFRAGFTFPVAACEILVLDHQGV